MKLQLKICTLLILLLSGCNKNNTINSIENFSQKTGKGLKDIDGNKYKSVIIGNQEWMAENLKVTKYNDGTLIPLISDSTQWISYNSGAYCYYNNNESNNLEYGKLYNWFAVSQKVNGNKNVCPSGWHIPTILDWTELKDCIAQSPGSELKESGTTHWNKPNVATNNTLFTALPGGIRDEISKFGSMGYAGYWWTASEKDSVSSISIYLMNINNSFYEYTIDMNTGQSVRCVLDK